MSIRNVFLVSTALVTGVVFAGPAVAADLYLEGTPVEPVVLPAVSGINGKISILGGSLFDEGYGALEGSLSVPVGTRYGLQLDAAVGVHDEDFVGGGAAHLFWRDPTIGLLGLYGSYTHHDDLGGGISRVGVEAEYYWDRVTVKGVVGAEFIDVDNVIEVDEENLFAFSDISYYAMDNLELSVGHRYTAETHALALGIEYQLDQQIFSSGVALFAEGRIGENDYEGIWGGVTFYIGDDKSLIRRHREDDPDDWGEDNLLGLILSDASCVPESFDLSEGFNTCEGEEYIP
ncbi:hypothetical protein [Pararhizobium sp. IMCC21322]|uniref:hypothetical protein n=1 Tax=Pararhizobium sp. IMCC21322 TaxID=3067903 RepID=UPI002741468A|nr:hypothetical protein [Pararhizobium sp. IMCC21322]